MKIENGVLLKVYAKDIVDGKYVVPEGVSLIGNNAFAELEELNEIELSKELKEIGDYAFMDCKKLKSIVLPKTCTSLGKGVFLDCENLSKIEIQSDLTCLNEQIFSGTAITEFNMSNTIVNTEEKCFENCKKLENFSFNESCKNIKESMFSDCSNLKNIILPKQLESIKDKAFKNCTSLEEINLPDTIKLIGSGAFSNTAIKKVKLPEKIESIEENLFFNCENLEEVILPENLKAIKTCAFEKCKNLSSIDLPNSIEELGSYAFIDCQKISRIVLPIKLNNIGNFCFSNTKLKFLEIPMFVETIGECAFENCKNLQSIVLPDGIKKISNGLFSKCESLEEVILPKKLETISEWAFFQCHNLKKIEIPQNVNSIGKGAFLECKSLSELTFPQNVTVLSHYVIAKCTNLKKFVTLGEIQNIQDSVFSELLIEEINLTESLKSISERNFDSLPNLKCINFALKDGQVMKIPVAENDYVKYSHNGKIHLFSVKGKIYYNNGSDIYVENIETALFKANLLYPNKDFSELKDMDLPVFNIWKKSSKFMPYASVVATLPLNYIDNFFVNNNCKKYSDLLKKSKVESFEGKCAFIKLCFALGLFEKEQEISNEANEFIENNIVGKLSEERIVAKYSKFNLLTGFKKDFVKFFTKYFEDSRLFLVKQNENDDGSKDLMTETFNKFNMVPKIYPHKKANTNRNADKLDQNMVMNVVSANEYTKILNGNEKMAFKVGEYGYSQSEFEELQKIFEKAKSIKTGDLLIKTTKDENQKIQYELLKKSNPLGLVVGNITNCCQILNNNGESCMRYGMEQPNSGFVTFNDGEKIIGQAWVWYDKETKVLCLDSVELPNNVAKNLNNNCSIKDELLSAIKRFSKNTCLTMKEKGYEVNKVTIGLSPNNNNILKKILSSQPDDFEKDDNPQKLSGYKGYTDTQNGQIKVKINLEKEVAREK